MMEFTACRDIDVMADGRFVIASFSVRYTFVVHAGRSAVTWHNATEGFGPAEDPTFVILKVETCWHPSHQWKEVSSEAFDMLTAEIPDEWFLDQAMEQLK